MNQKKLIVRGVFVTYVHYAVHFLSIIILTPIMLSYLGQTAFGVWSVFISLVGYFGLFGFGLHTTVAKYTAEYRAQNKIDLINKLISTTLIFFLCIGTCLVLICIGLLPFVPRLLNIPDSMTTTGKIAFFVLGLNSALMLISQVYGNIIYGYQRVDIWKSFAIVHQCSIFFLTILFLKLGLGLIGLSVAFVISTSILLCLYLLFCRMSRYNISFRFRSAKFAILKEIAPYSIRSFLLGLASQILYFTDNIVIDHFLGVAVVTPYAIAYRAFFFATYIFSAVSSTLFPRFSSLYAKGEINALASLYLMTTKFSLAVAMPLGIFPFFYGKPLIILWVGEENFVGTIVMLVFIAMNFIHAIGTPAGIVLQGIGKNKEITCSEIINAILNLTFSIFLVQKIGLLGVALGTILAHLCTSSWFVVFLACKYVKLEFRRYFFYAIFPAAVVGAMTASLIWMLKDNLFSADSYFSLGLNAVIIVFLYTVIFAFIGINRKERKLLRELFKK